jgi:hypothetical protein
VFSPKLPTVHWTGHPESHYELGVINSPASPDRSTYVHARECRRAADHALAGTVAVQDMLGEIAGQLGMRVIEGPAQLP